MMGTDSEDACTNRCAIARCGDEMQRGIEECDDGDQVDANGCDRCTLPTW